MKPGRHLFQSSTFRPKLNTQNDLELRAQNSSYIQNGTSHIVNPKPGNVVFLQRSGDPMPSFIEATGHPQVYTFDDPNVSVEREPTAINEAVVEKGPLRVVTVPANCIRMVEKPNGKLEILHPGRHVLLDANEKLKDGVISTLEKTKPIKQCLYSLDRVHLEVDVSVQYKITDAEKLLRSLGSNYERTIEGYIEKVLVETIRDTNYLGSSADPMLPFPSREQAEARVATHC